LSFTKREAEAWRDANAPRAVVYAPLGQRAQQRLLRAIAGSVPKVTTRRNPLLMVVTGNPVLSAKAVEAVRTKPTCLFDVKDTTKLMSA
jgi:hypothetical protein